MGEKRRLVSRWSKGSFDNVAKSIRYHASKHGSGQSVWKYLRKAADFNKRGARKTVLENGAVRWTRKSGEFLIEKEGKIVSYGFN